MERDRIELQEGHDSDFHWNEKEDKTSYHQVFF